MINIIDQVKNISLKSKGMKITDPNNLLDYSRFDIPAKTLWIKHRELGINSRFAEDLYQRHLKVWNGFSERYPKKRTFEDYKEAFIKIIDDIKNDRFDFKKSPIELDNKGKIFNGSHRIASAITFQKKIITQIRRDISIGDYDYRFFRDRYDHVEGGLDTKYLDAMALEYIKLKHKDLHVASIFPAANQDHDEKAEEILSKYSDIVYKKKIYIEKSRARNFIKQIYFGEHWATESTPESIDFKTNSVFNRDGYIRVYLIENKSNFDLVKCKEEIRKIYKVGKHSIHINDTYDETIRNAGLFFNENSIKFAKNSQDNSKFKIFNKLFPKYLNFLKTSKFDREFLVLDSSVTLGAYGLRDVRDLDFLHCKYKKVETNLDLISSHNPHDQYYPIHRDEIVMNPENHFYYLGVKVATPEIIIAMKRNRYEEKDKRDVKLLQSIIT